MAAVSHSFDVWTESPASVEQIHATFGREDYWLTRLGAGDARTWTVTVGGNSPQRLLNRLAVEIAAGRLDTGVLCGAESGRTRSAAKRNDTALDWTVQGEEVTPDWHDDAPFLMAHPVEVERGILMPTQTYPLFENALWNDSGRSLAEHLALIGEMWAGFSRVAATNPHAWIRQAFTAEEITTPSADNRMVSFPYTKRMVANPDVVWSPGSIDALLQAAQRWPQAGALVACHHPLGVAA
jgi:acetyl-CoA C-acetyltransferase